MAVAEAVMPAITSFSSFQAMEGNQFNNVSTRLEVWKVYFVSHLC